MKKTILIICVAAACILFGLVAFIGLSGRNKNEVIQMCIEFAVERIEIDK